MPPIAIYVIIAWSVCLYVRVILVHPAKADGRNEMPFGRDAHVVPNNIVLDSGPGPPQEEEIWGSEPSVKICIANCGQTVTDSRMLTIDSL